MIFRSIFRAQKKIYDRDPKSDKNIFSFNFQIVSFALAAVAAAQYTPVFKDSSYAGTRQAAILRSTSDNNPDGSYQWSYETENGIAASETGALKPAGPNGEPAIEAQGGYQYTAPDGQVIRVEYAAGADGFVAKGDHLPTPPPIPEAILRSLAWNAAHPQKEDAYYKPEPLKPYYRPEVTARPIYTSTPATYFPTTPKPVTSRPYFTQSPFPQTYQPYQQGLAYNQLNPQAYYNQLNPQAYYNQAVRR